MKENIQKEIEMQTKANRLRHKIEVAIKDGMERELEKQKIDVYAPIKTWLQELLRTYITRTIGKSSIEIKDDSEKRLKQPLK